MEGKKVLIFSQFVIMLDLIKEFLEREKYNVEILKGSISGTVRNQAIIRFNEDPNTDIFLISTKAGGVGINLISAS
jgi:SNF2 family DNA or RNA helicase